MAQREARIEHGDGVFTLRVPQEADVLRSTPVAPLPEPAEAIRASLAGPVDGLGLEAVAKGKRDACIVVSDATRPVPYAGESSILRPIIDALQRAGVADLTVLVACGTHRPMEHHELELMLDSSAFRDGLRVENHVSTDVDSLVHLGSTPNTPRVTVSRRYLEAELKILTGLVEPHFMAGWSGGRKAICPGICGQEVTYGFHSARMLDDPRATSLVRQGNPCHEESLTIARMAGADFTVNVTLDADKAITGVFSGSLEAAHEAACDFCATYTSIVIDRLYDIVIIPAGHVGVNHYQAGKAAVEGAKALREGGALILPAHLSDPDPIGGENYKLLLRRMVGMGADGFMETIRSPDWQFVPEQWQVQMFSRVYQHLGSPRNLFMCSPRLSDCDPEGIPDTNVARSLERMEDEGDLEWTARMVESALRELLKTRPGAEVLVLPDGPYAVPVLKT